MTEEFIQEVKTALNGLIGEGLPAEHHRILRKGDHDPEYKSHIRSINEQYYHLDSDVMSGNWLLVFVVRVSGILVPGCLGPTCLRTTCRDSIRLNAVAPSRSVLTFRFLGLGSLSFACCIIRRILFISLL